MTSRQGWRNSATAASRFTRYPGMEQDADDAWTAPDGTRVAWFTDPDGSVLSLHETA